MNMFELFSEADYNEMLAAKYIRENSHPYLDLRIINYTEKAQFDSTWNAVTIQCRGLIVNSANEVIARPFDKFMNYGQDQADVILMDYPVIVTDKMDGSLGILWDYKGEQGVATRGSFTSEQAIHATELWKSKYGFRVNAQWTYLFEIVYPSNRVVLNYGVMDELVLLGVRDIEEGSVLLPNDVVTWRGPRTQTFSYETLRDALEAPMRPNAEGFVVYFPDLDYRIKIKQEDYVALHKIVTGLTERRIWENMKAGKTLEDLVEIIPDEWHEWLRETYKIISEDFNITSNNIRTDYFFIMCDLENINMHPNGWTRKDFALRVRGMQYESFMFMILNNYNVTDKIWNLVRPSVESLP